MYSVKRGFVIEWSARSIKDMRRLTARDRDQVISKIEQFASDPGSLANQVITLAGSDYRRLRVGSKRVIFDIRREDLSVILVMRVRHRREAYD